MTQVLTTQISDILHNSVETEELLMGCEISSSHGGEYDVQSCLLGYTAV